MTYEQPSNPSEGYEETVRRLSDIEAIRQLKASYFRLMDTKDWTSWSELFVEDFHYDHDTRVATRFGVDEYGDDGRSAFVAFVSRALGDATSVHRGYTSEITITGPDTATGVWSMSDYVTFPSEGPQKGFHGFGHYFDEYVRTADGWRMKKSTPKRLRMDILPGGLPEELVAPTTSEGSDD